MFFSTYWVDKWFIELINYESCNITFILAATYTNFIVHELQYANSVVKTKLKFIVQII